MTAVRRVLFVAQKNPDDVTRRALESLGFAPTFADDWQRAWQHLVESEFSLIIADLGNGPGGIDFIKRVREADGAKRVPLLVLGEWGSGQPSLALSQGADAYEPTPIQAERLAVSIERLLTEQAAAAGWSE